MLQRQILLRAFFPVWIQLGLNGTHPMSLLLKLHPRGLLEGPLNSQLPSFLFTSFLLPSNLFEFTILSQQSMSQFTSTSSPLSLSCMLSITRIVTSYNDYYTIVGNKNDICDTSKNQNKSIERIQCTVHRHGLHCLSFSYVENRQVFSNSVHPRDLFTPINLHLLKSLKASEKICNLTKNCLEKNQIYNPSLKMSFNFNRDAKIIP